MTPVARMDDLITWTQPAYGLWIASAKGAHLGTIERTREGYLATASSGNPVGVYVSLTSAKHALLSTFPRLAPRHPGLVLLIVTVIVAIAVLTFAVTVFEVYFA
jgi:hypothetical protein